MPTVTHDIPNPPYALPNPPAKARRFKGDDDRMEYGHGAHDRRHGAAIFPQTLRWIFR